ncbi:MAG: hypothetical protein ABI081_01990 [Burkholderiaceae bacterium]
MLGGETRITVRGTREANSKMEISTLPAPTLKGPGEKKPTGNSWFFNMVELASTANQLDNLI